MRTCFLVKAMFIFISIQTHRADHELNITKHSCFCSDQKNGCGNPKISCTGNVTQWIGLRYFGFGLLQNGTKCDAIDSSSLIPIPNNKHCARSFTIDKNIIELFSGITGPVSLEKVSIYDQCKNVKAFFVANYDCIEWNSSNSLHFDQVCTLRRTGTTLNVASVSYPHQEIESTSIRSCSCNLTITATSLILRTYDNHLIGNQTMNLYYSNQTLIKRWEIAKNMTDVMNIVDLGPFVKERFKLNWENNANSNGGKLWFVIEAVNGNITTVCHPNNTGMSTTLATSEFTSTTTASYLSISNFSSFSTSNSSFSSSTTSKLNTLVQTGTLNITTSSPDTRSTKQSSQTLSNMSVSPSISTGLSSLSSNISSGIEGRQQVTKTQNPEDSDKPEDGKMSIGLLIGIILGGLFVIILLIICILFYCLKKKHRTEPERDSQPGNNKFNRDRIIKGQRNENSRESKPKNKHAFGKSGNHSSTNISLPPLPTGRNAFTSQKNATSVHQGKDRGRQNEDVIFMTNDLDNANLSHDLAAKLFEDLTPERSNDAAPLTEYNIDGRNGIGEQDITVTDSVTQGEEKKKKKKKKKKKRKKNNTIEALLDEENTSNA